MKRSLLGFMLALLLLTGCSYEPRNGYIKTLDVEEYDVYYSPKRDTVDIAIKSIGYGPVFFDLKDSLPVLRGSKRFGTDIIVPLERGQVYTISDATGKLKTLGFVLWTGFVLLIGSLFKRRKR